MKKTALILAFMAAAAHAEPTFEVGGMVRSSQGLGVDGIETGFGLVAEVPLSDMVELWLDGTWASTAKLDGGPGTMLDLGADLQVRIGRRWSGGVGYRHAQLDVERYSKTASSIRVSAHRHFRALRLGAVVSLPDSTENEETSIGLFLRYVRRNVVLRAAVQAVRHSDGDGVAVEFGIGYRFGRKEAE